MPVDRTGVELPATELALVALDDIWELDCAVELWPDCVEDETEVSTSTLDDKLDVSTLVELDWLTVELLAGIGDDDEVEEATEDDSELVDDIIVELCEYCEEVDEGIAEAVLDDDCKVDELAATELSLD